MQFCAARSGTTLRFVLGTNRLPEPAIPLVRNPVWDLDPSIHVAVDGCRFRLEAGGEGILRGTLMERPSGLHLEVGDAQIFGFGAATGAPDRNDASFRILARDTLLYGIDGASYTAFPFFMAVEGVRTTGVLLATPKPLDVSVTDGVVTLASAGGDDAPLDVIVLRGTPVQILREYAGLVGRTFLPPAWALGFHQSRWSYKSQQAVLAIARRFRALDLPADAIHLDIHYMDRYRVFTFNPRRFPRPSEMHEELRRLGFRTVAIVDPGVSADGNPLHKALHEAGMLVRTKDGRPYVGKVWPGKTVFPDFLQAGTRHAWGRLHEPLVTAGVSGIWNDMNEPVLRMGSRRDPLDEDLWHDDVSHRNVRNLYANAMAQATVSGLESLRPGRRHFVLSRSGSTGIQRHAAIWTGDNHSTWEHLRENLHMVLNLGLSGVPITGADVGGFGRGPGKFGVIKPRGPSAELFVRWMELGALMPFFRVHTALIAPSQEPWSFGDVALDHSRRLLRRRYRLLPLLYRLALEAHRDGLPIVRPLFMHFDVPRGAAPDQFLLGDALLAAPVMYEGAVRRDVWLPRGTWVDWHTGEVHQGGSHLTVEAPLGRTPLYVRSGATLFLATPGRNAEETLRRALAAEVTVPPPGRVGQGSLFLDDGESADGGRFVLDVSVEPGNGRLRVMLETTEHSFVPVQSDVELRVPGHFRAAIIDGERRGLVGRDLASEDRRVAVSTVRVPLSAREVIVEC